MTKRSAFFSTFALLLMLAVGNVFADVLNIKDDAPTTYVVKKGDTLWDISNLFLDKPWLWPELWRNNVQIENPHLIYPGDTLRLRYENGVPVIEVVREKSAIILSPNKTVVNKPAPIATLPWGLISPFINNDSIMEAEQYQDLPTLLGDNFGTPRFASTDYILAHKLPNASATYEVVRKERNIFDSKGRPLGVQVSHLSDATIANSLSNERHVIKLEQSNREARQGDKLIESTQPSQKDLVITPANRQTGEVVQNINGTVLIGKHDVVIVNVGKRDVKPGTVFGIYHQGPDVLYNERPSYTLTRSSIFDLFSMKERVEQPAYKIGELIIVRSYENASYAWVTSASTYIKGGEIIAKP
ncbi:MAG: LysM domain-containing protein [Glaciecola sp.]